MIKLSIFANYFGYLVFRVDKAAVIRDIISSVYDHSIIDVSGVIVAIIIAVFVISIS